MAASLDEIQGYDLLQAELEEALLVFAQKTGSGQNMMTVYTVNALIEYACFNLYLENKEQFDSEFVIAFTDWFKVFSGEELRPVLLMEFLDFVRSPDWRNFNLNEN